MIDDDYKYEFFKERLGVLDKSIIFDSFLKAITVFDAGLDKEIIKNETVFSGEILVDSLYYFKLEPLRERWRRTSEIILQNQILQSSSSMLEVIGYLTSNCEHKTMLADVLVTKKQIRVKNVSKLKIYERDFAGLSKFLTEIVELNPSKINLRLKNISNEEDITKILNKIFIDKIYLINS